MAFASPLTVDCILHHCLKSGDHYTQRLSEDACERGKEQLNNAYKAALSQIRSDDESIALIIFGEVFFNSGPRHDYLLLNNRIANLWHNNKNNQLVNRLLEIITLELEQVLPVFERIFSAPLRDADATDSTYASSSVIQRRASNKYYQFKKEIPQIYYTQVLESVVLCSKPEDVGTILSFLSHHKVYISNLRDNTRGLPFHVSNLQAWIDLDDEQRRMTGSQSGQQRPRLVDAMVYSGWPLLIDALQKDDIVTAKLLITKGANVNAYPTNYKIIGNCFMVALEKMPHDSIIELMLENGADTSLRAKHSDPFSGETILEWAEANCSKKTVGLLKKYNTPKIPPMVPAVPAPVQPADEKSRPPFFTIVRVRPPESKKPIQNRSPNGESVIPLPLDLALILLEFFDSPHDLDAATSVLRRLYSHQHEHESINEKYNEVSNSLHMLDESLCVIMLGRSMHPQLDSRLYLNNRISNAWQKKEVTDIILRVLLSTLAPFQKEQALQRIFKAPLLDNRALDPRYASDHMIAARQELGVRIRKKRFYPKFTVSSWGKLGQIGNVFESCSPEQANFFLDFIRTMTHKPEEEVFTETEIEKLTQQDFWLPIKLSNGMSLLNHNCDIVQATKLLAMFPALVNAVYNRRPVLFHALEGGKDDLARFLIEQGADVNFFSRRQKAYDDVCDTPFALAVYQGNVEMVLLMLQHGADPGHTFNTKHPEWLKIVFYPDDQPTILDWAEENAPNIAQIINSWLAPQETVSQNDHLPPVAAAHGSGDLPAERANGAPPAAQANREPEPRGSATGGLLDDNAMFSPVADASSIRFFSRPAVQDSLLCMAVAATIGLGLAGILGAGVWFLWAAAALALVTVLAQGYQYIPPLIMN